VNGTTFCVHGGVNPSFQSRADISTISKIENELVAEPEIALLWSDFDDSVEDFEENVDRGCGLLLGRQATADFLRKCRFSGIIRAHQTEDMGYNWIFGREAACLTVFSSCDYMGIGNDGAIAVIGAQGRIDVEVLPFISRMLPRKWKVVWPEWLLESPSAVQIPIEREGTDDLHHSALYAAIDV
jgi:diadenosine tetraphosphatase ApaH/serine/threonine PP2A family protein phosphatase